MSGIRVEAKAKYPLVGPANDDVHDNVYGCEGGDMGVMTPKSVLVGYLRCQVSQVTRFCTSRNRNAIVSPPQC